VAWRRARSIAGLVLPAALGGWVLVEAAEGIRLDEVRPAPLAAGFVLAGLAWLGLARAWTTLSGQPSTASTMSGWCQSQLWRYVPGALWAPAARVRRLPGPFRRRASVVMVEAALTLSTALVVGAGAYARRDTGHGGHWG
jgi:hypothetical protein